MINVDATRPLLFAPLQFSSFLFGRKLLAQLVCMGPMTADIISPPPHTLRCRTAVMCNFIASNINIMVFKTRKR